MQFQQSSSTPKQESFVSSVLYRYLPYWPLFVIVVGIFSLGAYCYLQYVTPKYEAVASIIIKDDKKGNDDSKSTEALNFFTTKKILENEIEVLKSWSLMNKVIQELHLYAPVYEEGKLKAAPAYLTSPITVEAAQPEVLAPVDKVYMAYDAKNAAVTINQQHQYKLNEWVQTPYGTLRFVANKRYKKSGESKPLYFSLNQPENEVSSLLGRLSVAPISKISAVIRLTYKDEVPKRAEDVLNALITAYNQQIINDKKALASNTMMFVDGRMNVVAKELDSIEKRIQHYKVGSGAIDIHTQGKLMMQSMSENDQKLSEINSKLQVLNHVEKAIYTKDKVGSIVPATMGFSDPVLTNLLNRLYESEMEYEKVKRTVGENHPMVTSIHDQMDKLKPHILDNIQSQRRSLLASRSSMSAANNLYSSVLQSIPQKEKNLLEIGRDQNIKSSIYSFLLQKREESAISIASIVSDMKIIDRAKASDSPVSPKATIVYVSSVIVALLCVVLSIGIKEAFSRKLLYRQEIASYTTMPIIGEITYKKPKQLIVVEDGKKSLMAEEFRKIRITLPYIGIGPNSRKVLVTSSIAGEGKSFIAANLAQTIALTGKKVVLVDMDLHNPSLGKLMADPNLLGISEYLAGKVDFFDIVNNTSFNKHLFFISAGAVPHNPTELLCSEKVKDLLNYLDSTFDYVIIDTAPVVPVSDAYELSAYCDATLFVVRHKYTPKMLIQRMDESVKINPLTNPAIIFNGVSNRGFIKNNYGYGYGYVGDFAGVSDRNRRVLN